MAGTFTQDLVNALIANTGTIFELQNQDNTPTNLDNTTAVSHTMKIVVTAKDSTTEIYTIVI